MRLSHKALPRVIVSCAFFAGVHVQAIDPPTWHDYLDVESLIFDKIEESTCPPANSSELALHWDYDGSDDCFYFPRVRNTRPLAPRLVRLAFHDAAGLMDGFVDLSDKENDGLESAVEVLDGLHAVGVLDSGKLVKDVVSKADLYSWAAIAAVRILADRQQDDYQEKYIPLIPVRYGRETYIPSDAADEGPDEEFPEMGASSTASQLETYFANKFGFSSDEVVALMGAHTLGGARRTESGYTGMWTQSKNKFNEEYFSNLEYPIPLADCGNSGVGGLDSCTFLMNEDGSCQEDGRCKGWEQVTIPFDGTRNFQWRHSCDSTGDGCTHLMLNVDMALYRDIDAHICLENDIFPGSLLPCDKGQIKSFPAHSPCTWGTSRILARCFDVRMGSGELIEINAIPDERNAWIDAFTIVFDEMMTVSSPQQLDEVMYVAPTSPPTPAPGLAVQAPCPVDTAGCFYTGSSNPFPCDACESGQCGYDLQNNAKCRGPNWVASTLKANEDPCPEEAIGSAGCVENSNPFDCYACASGTCGYLANQDTHVCKPSSWTPKRNRNRRF